MGKQFWTVDDLEMHAREEGRSWPPPFPGGAGERPDPLAEPEGYGQRIPGAANRPQHPYGHIPHQCSQTCQAEVTQTLGPTRTCGKVSVWHFTLADPQEHQYSIDMCAEHGSMMTLMAAQGASYCTTCREHPDPVDDLMRVAVRREHPWARRPDDDLMAKIDRMEGRS